MYLKPTLISKKLSMKIEIEHFKPITTVELESLSQDLNLTKNVM